MNNTLVTLEDRELSAVRGGDEGCGGYGVSGCGGGYGGYGFGFHRFGFGFHRFGFGGFGLGDDDCGAETDFDIRPSLSCDTGCGTVAVGGYGC